MPKLEIANDLRVRKEYLNLEEVRARFTRENPAYHKAQRLGFNTFGISPTIPLYRVDDDDVRFPRGLLMNLYYG